LVLGLEKDFGRTDKNSVRTTGKTFRTILPLSVSLDFTIADFGFDQPVNKVVRTKRKTIFGSGFGYELILLLTL
jgi:hypothetical protein